MRTVQEYSFLFNDFLVVGKIKRVFSRIFHIRRKALRVFEEALIWSFSACVVTAQLTTNNKITNSHQFIHYSTLCLIILTAPVVERHTSFQLLS